MRTNESEGGRVDTTGGLCAWGATGRLLELGGVALLLRTVGLIECVLPGPTVIGHLEAYRSLGLHVLAGDWPRRSTTRRNSDGVAELEGPLEPRRGLRSRLPLDGLA